MQLVKEKSRWPRANSFWLKEEFKFHTSCEFLLMVFLITILSECNDDVFCCKVSPSSKLIAVCTNKGLVIIYRVSDGRKMHQLVDTDTRQKSLPAVTCHWINEDKIVAGYCDGKIKVHLFMSWKFHWYNKVWNVSNQQCLKTIEEDRTVYQTMVTPTKDALITAGKDSDINVYDLDTLQKINTCKGKKHHISCLFNLGWRMRRRCPYVSEWCPLH